MNNKLNNNKMRQLKSFAFFFLCLNFLIVSASFAQQKSGKLSIIVKNQDNFFVDEGSDFYATFILKGIDDSFNTKDITSRANNLEGVFKFGIKNSSDNIANQRRCYIRLHKENYLKTFSQVLIFMNVDKVEIDKKLIDTDKFLLEYKK